jgi:hypothetical protein
MRHPTQEESARSRDMRKKWLHFEPFGAMELDKWHTEKILREFLRTCFSLVVLVRTYFTLPALKNMGALAMALVKLLLLYWHELHRYISFGVQEDEYGASSNSLALTCDLHGEGFIL